MELKIECSCGSKYKFDVEPVDGRVPAPLSCPNCQASWTEHANAMIAQNLGLTAPVAAPVAAVSHPAPMAGSPPPPAVPSPARVGLRLSGHTPAQSAPVTPSGVAEEPAAASSQTPAARHIPHVPSIDPVVDQYDTGSFGRGILGAAAGALLGGIAFYLLFAHTGVRLKILALGVGFLAGMGARLLGKDRSKELGILGAMLSIGMIVGAQYLVAWKWFHEGDETEAAKPSTSEYDERVAEAKKVLAAIPNGTDQEIRLYLAKELADEGEKPDPKSIDPDEIREFKAEDLPRYRKFADGTITKEQFEKEQTESATLSAEDRQKEKEEGERVFKLVFLAFLLGKFNLACMAGAAGIAYKMIADA